MLEAFLDGATSAGADVRRLYVRDLEIRGCIACGYCDKAGECITKDGMSQVYPLLEEAAGIVVASPIYFYGVTGQLKLLIDRSQALFMKRELARASGAGALEEKSKKGFLLCAGATKGKRMFECAALTVRYFLDALGAAEGGEICVSKLDEKGSILARPEVLEDCRNAGARFAVG
jgi:multimeric flavodoxin WrbA